jgi:hypothetical protein
MASFTDQIPQFNPYIKQLPVEAMVQVGMEKQRRYDEGLQKIQTSIDNIAGLEVIKPLHKAYLESSLKSLGSKLKTVAAGDFSNYQLVNSVGGMTKQIVKDPVIQNAVSSTAKYKKELSKKEALEKEGKTSPSNDYVFNLGVSKWLNSDDINTSYDGSYDQFSNWRKNGVELLKAMTGDSTITDDAFTLDKKGNLVIADAIVRKKVSGISPEKIQEALLNGLSPADFKQMQIDSIYNYANQDADKFKETINTSFADKTQHFLDQRRILENAKPSTTDVQQKDKLDSQIASLDKYIKNLTNQQKSLLSMIDNNNLDGAKSTFGTSNSIAGFSKAFSNTQISTTYENSALLAAQQFRETKEQDWNKFIMGYEQDERFHTDTLKESKRANDLKEKEVVGYGGLPVSVDQNELPKYNLNRVVKNVEAGKKALLNDEKIFLNQQGKDATWLAQQKLAWEKSPNAVDPVIAAYFNNNVLKQRNVDSDQAMIDDINKQAVKVFGTIDNLIPKNAPSVTYTAPGGIRYNYTPKDFVNFNSKLYKYFKPDLSSAEYVDKDNPPIIYDDRLAKEELTDKEYHLYKTLQIPKNKLNSADRTLINNVVNYKEKVNNPYKKTLSEINKFTANEVAKRLSASQGVSYQIATASAAQKSSISTMITQFADLADKQKGGLANSPDWDSETARALSQDDNTRYSITVVDASSVGPASYKMTATGKDGTISWKVTPEQKAAIFGNQFEASPEVRMASPYLQQLNKMGGYSTSLDGKTSNVSNSAMGKVDFPNVQNFGVKANLVQPYPGQYSVRLSVYNPISKKWQEDLPYPKSGLIDETKIAPALLGLNDSVIYEMLYNKPATSNDLNKIKQATKNPL